jgi:hypothetical protein
MKNKLEKLPFNGLCQTKGCEGTFQPIENYEYKEHERTNQNSWDIAYKTSHNITVHQCTTCGRIHGEVKLTTGQEIEFFEGQNKPVSFQTPSIYGQNENVTQWSQKELTPTT